MLRTGAAARQLVSRRVRALIEETGSQRAAAARLGVGVGFVSDLLKGRRSPGPHTARKLGLKAVRIIGFEDGTEL